MESTTPLVIAAVAALLLALGAWIDDRRNRARRFAAVRPEAEPPLVHSINDDRCIGCEACVDACPTEVLELVDHKARVIRFGDCVQCEQCMNACPTTALVMHREGAAPQTLTVPEIDERFQTGVPGQFLIGEVAGKPLVKNAANLGRAVVEHIARELGAGRAGDRDVLDVVVVGSGPAGLSAGLTCLHHKLSCVVLEKEHVIASTVARYPKGKLFMAEPVNDRNVSFLPVFDGTKEELVGAWQKVVEGVKLPVRLGESVETVKRGDDELFTIKTTVATYRCRKVVLATGLRGKPRLLAVPGANLEKVRSRLDDPDAHAGEHVLVVGGGDSAVEAAIALADVAASVVLSYRGDGFKRCKPANQKRLAAVSAENRIEVLLGSNVKEFTADEIRIELAGGEVAVRPNQRAFVLIGADTPVAWLEANNVRFVERPHLYALGSTEETVRRVAAEAAEGTRDPAQAIAILLGKPAPRPSNHRIRTMVSHLRDELRDAVTSVSGAFKLPVAPPPPRVAGRAHTVARARTPQPQPLIPPASLVRGPKLYPRQPTATRVPHDEFAADERTLVGYVIDHARFEIGDDDHTLAGDGRTLAGDGRTLAGDDRDTDVEQPNPLPAARRSVKAAPPRPPTPRAPSSPRAPTTPPALAVPRSADGRQWVPPDPHEFDDEEDALTIADQRARARRRSARGTPDGPASTDAKRMTTPPLPGLPPRTAQAEKPAGTAVVCRKVVSG
jgi:thioredoxin reductase/ferredoxin